MPPRASTYNPRNDALLAALPPFLIGTLLPGILAGLIGLDRLLGHDPVVALARFGRWQASSELTVILGFVTLSAFGIGFLAAIAAAIVLRFPLWHYAWSGTALVLALAFACLLSEGAVTPLILLVASPPLVLLAAGWIWAWRSDATESGLFGLGAVQATTLLLLLAASSPPLLRPDLVPWALPMGLLNAGILFLAVYNPPGRRLAPLVVGLLLNVALLPLLNGSRLGALWVGPRGLVLLAIVGTTVTLAGPLWHWKQNRRAPEIVPTLER